MTWLVAGERIRALRHLLGVSQQDLADSAGVSQALISHVESGAREATTDLIAVIAAATATPRRFFEVPGMDIPLGTLRFRKYSTAKRSDTRRVKALFDEALRIVVDLMEKSKYPQPNLPMATSEPTGDDIEELALRVREALQLTEDRPLMHLIRSCERAGVAVAPLTLAGEHDNDDEIVGHFGVSHWWGAREPALIGYFNGGSGDRQRYTVAHELAHLVLHTRRHVVARPEDEANRLAGAILMPKGPALEVLSEASTLRELAQVKAHWGISIQALIMRGSHLGLVDERRRISLFKQLSARGWRTHEPVSVSHEEPQLLWRLLERRYGNPVPFTAVADDLGLHAFIVKSLAPSPRPRTSPPPPGVKVPTARISQFPAA